MTGQMHFGSHMDGLVATGAELANVSAPGWRRGREVAGDPTAEEVGEALRLSDRRATNPHGERLRALVEVGRRVRTAFERVEAGDLDGAASHVNDLLAHYRPVPILSAHDDQPVHLHFHGDPAIDISRWAGGIAVALAMVLGSEHARRLGVCSAPACDRVFVDVSRNGTKRFCSTSCQSRVKAAAHRARRGEGG